MKKMYKFMSSGVVSLCTIVAATSLFNTCFWIFHQPEEPQELVKKLDK